ncbi:MULTISPECIES: hypothetical protein [unclassified Mycobacterium]|uniref:hypothetical protein n=1 Tax=unclassified Mycobacterium TaxID=2642494 RepID=UPI0029C87453|nr:MULTISPECIES: hypothetical protein [unclassified Mycobacterium]
MSAPKAGTYVLAAASFYRVEGEGDEAVRRRYKRGDNVELSKAEAARLAVPTRLAPPSFVKAGDVVPGDDLRNAPPIEVNTTSQANQLVADANNGLNTPSGDGLTEAQVKSEVTTPPVTGAGVAVPTPEQLGDTGAEPVAPTGENGQPAKSATVEVWRDYAVSVEAVKPDEAGDMTKALLQEAVARKAAAG